MIFNLSGGSSANSDVDLSKVTAKAAHVLTGYDIVNSDGEVESGTMPNRGKLSSEITSVGDIIQLSNGYYSGGSVSIAQSEIEKLIPANIPKGMTILGIEGEAEILESPNNCVILTGEVSESNLNLVISGISGIKAIQHVYAYGTSKNPDQIVVGAYGNNLNLSAGGSASVRYIYGDYDEGPYENEAKLQSLESTATFDGSTLTIPTGALSPYSYMTYVIIGESDSGEYTKAQFNGTFTPASSTDNSFSVMCFDTSKYVKRLEKITGIFINYKSTYLDRLVYGSNISLVSGGSVSLDGLLENGTEELTYSGLCTATFDGLNVTLTLDSEFIESGYELSYTIIGE